MWQKHMHNGLKVLEVLVRTVEITYHRKGILTGGKKNPQWKESQENVGNLPIMWPTGEMVNLWMASILSARGLQNNFFF